MSGVLEKRLQRCIGAAQCGLRIGPVEDTFSPRGSRTSDPADGSFARADAEGAGGNCKRPQVRAFDFFAY